jgi:hypothetical protein
MDAGLYDSRDQVGLEFVEVDVERTVESQRCGDRGDNVSDQPVEVLVGWLSDVQVSLADVVDAVKGRSFISVLSEQALSSGEPRRDLTHASLSTMNEQSECSRVV